MLETYKTVVTVSRDVFNLLLHEGALSAWQVADRMDRNVYTVRPRLTELFKAGKIKEIGKRWCDRTQRHETVWEVVDHQIGLFNP
jgi:predicted ArsR family transcriptional regulator